MSDIMIHPTAFIHYKALVTESRVGAGTKIWQFASVIRGATIGARCNIASGACIDGSDIGDDCVIAHNLAMGPGFKIGNGVFIGPNVTFCNDAWPRAGKDGFDADAYIGSPAVLVEDGASIGANAVILPGVRIGSGAMIAAGAVVCADVRAGELYMGRGEVRKISDETGRIRIRRARADESEARAFAEDHGID